MSVQKSEAWPWDRVRLPKNVTTTPLGLTCVKKWHAISTSSCLRAIGYVLHKSKYCVIKSRWLFLTAILLPIRLNEVESKDLRNQDNEKEQRIDCFVCLWSRKVKFVVKWIFCFCCSFDWWLMINQFWDSFKNLDNNWLFRLDWTLICKIAVKPFV